MSVYAPALALFLTHGMHAVAWTFVAGILDPLPWLSWSARHRLWKLALVGPLASTLLTLLLPKELETVVYTVSLSPVAELITNGSSVVHAIACSNNAWPLVAHLCAGAGVLGACRWLRAVVGLRRTLRARRPLDAVRWVRCAQHLQQQFDIGETRLTTCASIQSPVVVMGSEICIPSALVSRLSGEEIEATLAHEMAHLERRDAFWFPLVALVQHLFCCQLLVHFVSARLRRTAELACDERAVEVTRNPLGLASALTSVATAALRPSSLAPRMVRSEGELVRRVKRLVDQGSSATPSAAGRGIIFGASLAGLLLAGMSIGAVEAAVPDALSWSARMLELSARGAVLESTLAGMDASREAHRDDFAVLELQQELRHIRATQVWLEQRFVAGQMTEQTRPFEAFRP